MRSSVGILVLALVAGGARAAVPVRAEVPVREVVLSDGVRRYAVPIRIGATAVEAGLDTGSTGLRVLPGAVSDTDARPTSHADTYSYGAGAKLDGVTGEATVSVAGLSGATTLQLVQRVGCSAARPRCAAGSIPLPQYGIQGDGLPGEGFKAILGANMAEADVASLFRGIGARRWIIDLPRPGEGAPGRIVLNPTDEEAAGFTPLPIIDRYRDQRGGLHDAVQGCLVNDATRAKICGAVLLDTGAPGIEVKAADAPAAPWAEGAPATLLLADAGGHVKARERLVIGRRAQATRLTMTRADAERTPVIYAGLAPYFAFSVLYDPAHGTVALRPRSQAPDGPVGALDP